MGGVPYLPFLVGGCPPLSLLQVVRKESMLLLEECPPPPSPGFTLEVPVAGLGCCPPCPGCAQGTRAVVWRVPPPSPPCWLYTLITRYHLGGSPSSFSGWPRTGACTDCSVPLSPYQFHWCSLSQWYPRGCSNGILGVVPASLRPRNGWVACQILRRQYSLLAAHECAVLGPGAVGMPLHAHL